MNKYIINGFERITKTAARKLYNNGGAVTVCPCKLAPGGGWAVGVTISNASGRDFQKVINEFIFYNCNAAAGYYPAYYMRLADD